MTKDETLPVLIVGAGPTGMTAALALARYDIPSIIVDQDNKLSDGSRAIAYHHSTLAVWEKLGVGAPILAKGIVWNTRQTFLGEKKLYTQSFLLEHSALLPRFLNLQQYYLEAFLLERIQSEPLITLHWEHKVVGFTETEAAIQLEIETHNGTSQLTGTYALACDGARSSMRNLLDLDFPGSTFDDLFLIVDIKADLDDKHEPRFYFDHPAHAGPSVLIHPQPDGVWRIDWQIGAHVDIEAECSPEKMDARIRAIIGEIPYEIVWLSHYRFHQRLLDEFKHGRVIFVGDSAHLVAPFGARGLNSAVLDTENLVWKLVLVLHNKALETLLNSFQAECWPAQKENQRVTINTMEFMAPNTKSLLWRKNFILWLNRFWAGARQWVDSGKMVQPFTYTDSPLNQQDVARETWTHSLPLGARVDDVIVEIVRGGVLGESPLRHLLGDTFVFFAFVQDAAQAEDLLAQFNKLRFKIPAKLYPILPDTPTEYFGNDVLMIDGNSNLQKRFDGKLGTVYVVRPDRHVVARRRNTQPEDWDELLQRICS